MHRRITVDITRITRNVSQAVTTVDSLVGAVEAIVLAVVGRAASWVASVPCAVMTARASVDIFALSWPVAVIVAVALELVGQATSNGWLRAKEWNATKRKADPAADVVLAQFPERTIPRGASILLQNCV